MNVPYNVLVCKQVRSSQMAVEMMPTPGCCDSRSTPTATTGHRKVSPYEVWCGLSSQASVAKLERRRAILANIAKCDDLRAGRSEYDYYFEHDGYACGLRRISEASCSSNMDLTRRVDGKMSCARRSSHAQSLLWSHSLERHRPPPVSRRC